jgi:hypothetical protein
MVGRRAFSLETSGLKGNVEITEIISKSARGAQKFEAVNWYFQVRERLFHAVLLSHDGDPRRQQYIIVMKQVVQWLTVDSK